MKPGLKPHKTLAVLGERYFDSADLLGEVWKDIPDDFGACKNGHYQVSNMGRVRNSTNSILGGDIDSCGYHVVVLYKFPESTTKAYFVHKLVLLAFGDSPVGTADVTVQHKNHNKLDNRIDNLMWMSPEDNNRDGHATRVHILGTDKYFDSRELASLSIGRWGGYISECMHNGNPVLDISHNVVHFEYLSLNTSDWQEYIPAKSVRLDHPKKCCIVDKFGNHEFSSMCDADRYLNRYEGYIRYRYNRNVSIYNSEDEEVMFKFI